MSQTANALAADSPRPPEDTDKDYEVVNGQRREIEPMGAQETLLAWHLSRYLGNFVISERLGIAVTEMLFLLDAEGRLQRKPDVAYVPYSRWPERIPPRAAAWNVIPDVAVEVVGPTNLADEIDAKITDYFGAGVRQVWVLYPESRRIYVYNSPTEVYGLAENDTLRGGDVLPGFELPLAELWSAIERPE